MKGLYRGSNSSWAGGHSTVILVGEYIIAKGDSRKAWSKNGKWSGTESTHTVQVRRDWLVRVDAHELAVVDGLLTLDAEPIQGHGPELFRATWVEQGRGCDIHAVHGYIARVDSTTYHAPSARAALDGVQRKAGLKPARRKGQVDLDKIARRYGDLPVTWEDGKAVGACDAGLRSWCNAVGISTHGATLAEVISGYKLRPHVECLAVIRRVVRDRHNRQPEDLSSLNGAANLLGEGRVIFDAEGGFRIEGV
jgi:hypothetical protein